MASFSCDSTNLPLTASPPGPYTLADNGLELTFDYTNGSQSLSNPCTTIIKVVDREPPTISCPATVTFNVDAGACSSSQVPITTASDNCLDAPIELNPTTPAGPYPVGDTVVTFSTRMQLAIQLFLAKQWLLLLTRWAFVRGVKLYWCALPGDVIFVLLPPKSSRLRTVSLARKMFRMNIAPSCLLIVRVRIESVATTGAGQSFSYASAPR
jgi:hypothetical protein